MALVLPVVMCVGLTLAEESGFGEFKDKLKPDGVAKAYFLMTLLYRTGLGFYLAAGNEDNLSTLMVMAISIGFLLYSLVNLPFTKAYHNYRCNLCHLTNFVTLFVVMYYRSMMSSVSYQEVGKIYAPAYLELACILLCLGVSIVILGYEIYIYVQSKVESCNKEDTNESVEKTENDVNGMNGDKDTSNQNIYEFTVEDI